jgi:tetrahydromethanopterin:alpha-L-glutamate ligase
MNHDKLPRIAVIGAPGRWSSEQLADAIEQRTGFRLLAGMEELVLSIDELGVSRARIGGHAVEDLDAVIVKKVGADYSHDILERLELLRHLSKTPRGVDGQEPPLPIFSSPDGVLRAVDRLACTLALQRGGVPIPATVITESIDEAVAVATRFGRSVLKPLFTSKARGMVLLDASEDPRSQIEIFHEQNPVMYIQQMVELPDRDIGLVFLGSSYLGSYARVRGANSWNTTTHFGGHYERCEPSSEIIELASRAAALFSLDFTSVDIAETPAGPVVFEVSAFGGFKGLAATQGINAAELYANYVLEWLERGALLRGR